MRDRKELLGPQLKTSASGGLSFALVSSVSLKQERSQIRCQIGAASILQQIGAFDLTFPPQHISIQPVFFFFRQLNLAKVQPGVEPGPHFLSLYLLASTGASSTYSQRNERISFHSQGIKIICAVSHKGCCYLGPVQSLPETLQTLVLFSAHPDDASLHWDV